MVLVLVLLTACATAQAGAKGSAEGSLTVTTTVVASTSLIVTPDGEEKSVIANAIDPADNISRLVPSETHLTVSKDEAKKVAKKADHHK